MERAFIFQALFRKNKSKNNKRLNGAFTVLMEIYVYKQEVKLNKKTRQLEYITVIATSRQMIKEIKLFELADFLINKINNLRNEITRAKIRLLIKYSFLELLVSILRNFALGICLFITCYDIYEGKSSVGNIALVISAIQAIIENITTLYAKLSDINQNSLYFSDWVSLNNLPNEKEVSQKIIKDYTITLKDISFSYPGTNEPVLNGVSFEIPQNSKIAIVGDNGSGKSTLIHLILGSYEATKGKIYVGDNELWEVMNNFRSISVPVFQDFLKYQLSVGENIEAGNFGHNIDYEKFNYLGFADFIKTLPSGLQTKLGQLHENGIDLSGGEWQKIAIFRALSRKNSKVLILDEPTASLDPLIESEIYEEFTHIGKDKTVILISHRLSAAKLCDNIIVLDNGKVLEQGNHDQLMRCKGKYYEMFTLQKKLYT